MKHISVLWQPVERAEIWDGNERVPDENSIGVSEADTSALAWALECADEATVIEVCSVGDERCVPILRSALAHGATHVRHLHTSSSTLNAQVVANVLAGHVPKSDLILTGSAWGSGLVPVLLGAHRSIPAVAGVLDLRSEGGRCWVRRRLDGGRRQELRIALPALLAVESGKPLPRASLPKLLEAANAVIPTTSVSPPSATPLEPIPWKAPTAWVAPPVGPAAGRIAQLTGNAGTSTTTRISMSATPEVAAATILKHLQEWGYCSEPDPVA